MTPFNMSMGIMACYISAGIAYNLAQSYTKLTRFPCAMLSLMTFLLIAAPMKDGTLPANFGRHRYFHHHHRLDLRDRADALPESA